MQNPPDMRVGTIPAMATALAKAVNLLSLVSTLTMSVRIGVPKPMSGA